MQIVTRVGISWFILATRMVSFETIGEYEKMKRLILLSMLCFFSCQVFDPLVEQPMPVENLNQATRDILIVSHHTLDANYLDFTWENHRAYAKKHGYAYWFRNGVIDASFKDPNGKNKIFTEGLYWQKIATVSHAMDLTKMDSNKKFGWIMWIDADAVFTDLDKEIEHITSQASLDDYLIIAHDYGNICINTGIWLIRNDDRGRKFLELVKKSFPYFKALQYPEQYAVEALIYGVIHETAMNENKVGTYVRRECKDSSIQKGMKVLPQRAMNAYYTDYAVNQTNSSWQAGDYIAHVAAGADKRALLKRLLSCIKEMGKNFAGCAINGSWQEASESINR